jgi:hypothetical protein
LIVSTRSASAPLFRLGLAKFHDKRVGHIRRYRLHKLIELVVGENFKVEIVKNTEGLLSDFLFSFPNLGNQIIRVANKFLIASKILGFIDTIFLTFFGSSQIIIIARKV